MISYANFMQRRLTFAVLYGFQLVQGQNLNSLCKELKLQSIWILHTYMYIEFQTSTQYDRYRQ